MTPRLRRWGFLCGLVLLAGCAPRPGTAKPPPRPNSDPVAAAAEQAIRDYATGLARVARETAANIDTFKSQAEVFDAVEQASGAVHTSAFGSLGEAADQAVKPDGPYDAAAVKKLLESEGTGFERAVGGHK
jgi:hypothetical protein